MYLGEVSQAAGSIIKSLSSTPAALNQGKGAGETLQSTAWVATGVPVIYRSRLSRHRLYFVLPKSWPHQAVDPIFREYHFCALAADLGADQWDGQTFVT